MTAPVIPTPQQPQSEQPHVIPGWYADPSGRHQVRYADEQGWTDTVSDGGVVSREALPAAPPAAPARRRRRPWLIAALVAAVVVIGALVLFGVDRAMKSLDTYQADLTNGAGDFPVRQSTDDASFYAGDGYHMVNKTTGWQVRGLDAPTEHTVLGVRLTVHGVRVPAGARFGPLARATNGGGFAFVVDGTGRAQLLQISSDGTTTVVATAAAPALGAGTTRELLLACTVSPTGSTSLAGYVDGAKVISGKADLRADAVKATGMVDYVGTNPPAEWVVPKFARIGPDELP